MKTFSYTTGSLVRAFCLVAITISAGLVANVSLAKEHAARNHAHDRDFYALSNVGETVDHTAVHHSNCFMTSTAAESARGIRHWSGSC